MQESRVTRSALSNFNIMAKAWRRRLAQIPFAKKAWCWGDDFLKAMRFWINKTEPKEQYNLFESCQSLEDYFQFAGQLFRPHQIKHEILNFLEFARSEQPEQVCEIGTADGGTNFLLSQALPSTRLMIGIDLYVKNSSKLHYFSRANQQLNFINGSSSAKFTIGKVKQILAEKKLDLLFIDGDHSYDGVKQDFLNYRHLVRDGGLIIFHDIVPDYLTRYGIQTDAWVGDVPRFWSKVKSLYPHYEFVENPGQDGRGIGAIRYSAQIAVPEDL